MTELAGLTELENYFSSHSQTDPAYVSKLSRLLELARFEKTEESDAGIYYKKENWAFLRKEEERHQMTVSTEEALDTPFCTGAKIYHDGNIEVTTITYGMIFSAQTPEPARTEVQSQKEYEEAFRQAARQLDVYGAASIQTPNAELNLTRLPELKNHRAVQYILELARQARLSF